MGSERLEMTDTTVSKYRSNGDQVIVLREIAGEFNRLCVPLLILVLICTAAGIAAALLMKPVYRATVVMMPAVQNDEADRLRGFGGQLSGLAALAGVGGQDSVQAEEALAILKSRLFMERFIESQNLLPILFEGIWDATGNAWNVDDQSDIPTMSDAVTMLDGTVRSIIRDNSTGLLSMHIDWRNRDQAGEWANLMINMANRHLRDRAIDEAEKSIAYLETELGNTTSIEVRSAIYGLMENQIRNIMFANVLEEYAFKVIDPAVSPDADDFIRPNRPLLIVLGFVTGLFLAVAISLLAAIREKNFVPAG